MIDKISGGNETRTAGGGSTNPGGGENPGGGGGTGGPGGGGTGGGEGGGDGGAGALGTALATCLSSGKAYGYCLEGVRPRALPRRDAPDRRAQPHRQGHQEHPQLRPRPARPEVPGPRRRTQQGGQRVPRHQADGQQQAAAGDQQHQEGLRPALQGRRVDPRRDQLRARQDADRAGAGAEHRVRRRRRRPARRARSSRA